MAMTITVAITVAEEQGYTAHEAAVLAAVQAHPSQGAAAVIPTAAQPAAATLTTPVTATKEAADARIAVAKAKAKAKEELAAKTLQEAVVKTPEPAEAEEPAPGVDFAALEAEMAAEATEAPTMQDAVTVATAAINAGKQAAVKAALGTLGAKRVSELHGANIAAFITALEG